MDQRLASDQPVGIVDFQHDDRGASDWRDADQDWAVPLEVFVPNILPRVEEARHLERMGVNSSDVRAFVEVAVEATQGQVQRFGRAAAMM